MKVICCGLKTKEYCHVLVNQFHGNFYSKTLGCRKTKAVFRDVNDALMNPESLQGKVNQKYKTIC